MRIAVVIEHQGKISGKDLKFAIVVSKFNLFVTENLLKGALECMEQHHVDMDTVEVFWVAGAFEIPQMAQIVARMDKFDGILCLGAVIRGETPHFDYISAESAHGIAQVGLQEDLPVVYGVLTTDTVKQAIDRSGGDKENKGREATLALLEISDLKLSLTK
jgi:6,7-dimethyl-8-ribityllumazine synthase